MWQEDYAQVEVIARRIAREEIALAWRPKEAAKIKAEIKAEPAPLDEPKTEVPKKFGK